MTYIISGLCARHGGCVEVCPVDCIHPGQPMNEWPWYYIDPETCIDCGLCVPACPYHAIFPEAEIPDWLQDDIRFNYEYVALLRREGRL